MPEQGRKRWARVFFEKGSGLGVVVFKAKQEDKVVMHDFIKQPTFMVVESPGEYKKD